ncbi:hypothetical protein JA33_153 [Dickeya phage vB_DsoM_JA33]|uniref:Uncharacterized protein n=3 Tax=Salmondvirus JA11 TaxID=2734141 RepID=A0A384ZWF2_9CAUD|nr:hypothetical protein HOU32_gp153 [Dickeya phage vB_DsoM_JA11]AXG66557.1 hypothetical protein JA13_154 [Dickeya phage vB_DsoM_JA13]AXG67527.1 hypothetical protein JA33_153 [Dickeya phage vB_DsoM_JA33]AYD79958.1 hypothetical protein JA11_153 [Dickeya phage vB_DsoM_JA11]
MRQDQALHLFSKSEFPDLNHAVCRVLGYNHYDWISKDVDAYFAHVPERHKVTYEIPEEARVQGLNAQEIADAIKAGPYYTEYNDALQEGQQGRMVIHDYQIFPSEKSTSGWRVVFSYSFIQFDLPYW